MIEPLENRIAPAAVFTYIDVDGDRVTIKTSKGTNAELAAIIAKVDVDPGADLREQVQTIDFSANAAVFAGTTLTVTAKRTADGGNGHANIGYIDATDIDGGTALDLGVIKINGDLGRIRAGDDVAPAPAVKLLRVTSMGTLGISTQDGAGTLRSALNGDVGAIVVKTDVKDVAIRVSGKTGAITIGGSLIGGADADTGQIDVVGNIGAVKIGVNVIGGDGAASGRIVSDGSIASVTVGGSMMAGDGSFGASIRATGSLGPVKIGGNISGKASNSGYIGAQSLASLTIGGSIIGEDSNSGEVRIEENVGPVKIGGDMRRSPGSFGSGIYSSTGMIGAVRIGGSMIGTTLTSGGSEGTMGPISVRGDVDDASIDSSAALAAVSIGGDLIGRASNNEGEVRSSGNMGPVRIGGDLRGGSGLASGVIISSGALAQVTIEGSVFGGSNIAAGSVLGNERVGRVTIGGSVYGGSFSDAGSLSFNSNVGAIEVRGSVYGGTVSNTGLVTVDGTLGSLVLRGDLHGSSLDGVGTLVRTAVIQVDRVLSIQIGGSIVGGVATGGATLTDSGAIHATFDIGSLMVAGDIIGHPGDPVVITATGQEAVSAGKDVAMRSITVKGRVEWADILAGYNPSGSAVNADAQIGSVTAGSWISSDLVAGVSSGSDSFFGDNNDAKIGLSDDPQIIAKIGSVIIKGQVIGDDLDTGVRTFGFVAEQMGVLRIGGAIFTFLAGAGNDTFAAGAALAVAPTKTSFAGVADGFDVHAYEVPS